MFAGSLGRAALGDSMMAHFTLEPIIFLIWNARPVGFDREAEPAVAVVSFVVKLPRLW
jgi:hypothetical protein